MDLMIILHLLITLQKKALKLANIQVAQVVALARVTFKKSRQDVDKSSVSSI